MKRADAAGLAVVLLVGAALYAFRMIWFEPRDIALACLHGGPAVLCGARAGLAWLDRYYVFGGAALLCGIYALARGGRVASVAAVCLGVGGLINYNISWGMHGAALGIWAWSLPPYPQQARGAAPEPRRG